MLYPSHFQVTRISIEILEIFFEVSQCTGSRPIRPSSRFTSPRESSKTTKKTMEIESTDVTYGMRYVIRKKSLKRWWGEFSTTAMITDRAIIAGTLTR